MSTKQVLLFLLVFSHVHVILAQTRSTLTGKVTAENGGKSLQGATVHIHDINRDAVSNENGEYKTSFLPAGVYLVEVSHVGYTSNVETVVINGETSKDFSLKTAVVEQEGVTVTGVSLATRLKQSPQPVMVMKKAELFKLSSSNFINGLTHLPGVNALTTDPAISKPFIRGLGHRVEVLKGPASLMYGSDGLAGVINVQSLTPGFRSNDCSKCTWRVPIQ